MSTIEPVDLMLDVKYCGAGEPMTVIHIVKFGDGHFNVVQNGKVAPGLTWDEMLGQIVSLSHPRITGASHYRLFTREDWIADRKRHAERMAEIDANRSKTHEHD